MKCIAVSPLMLVLLAQEMDLKEGKIVMLAGEGPAIATYPNSFIEFRKEEPMPDGGYLTKTPQKPKGKQLSWQDRKMGKRR